MKKDEAIIKEEDIEEDKIRHIDTLKPRVNHWLNVRRNLQMRLVE